ncbi:MAG: molecular chaperone DnaJ [Alphaproteobacteria bacterium]|nr:molecular chaperone DnaJ [Alphaproteobacteria bacterium]
MAKRDYYETLGVRKGVPADELKRAFRKLAKDYHPDRNPGDPSAELKFKEINEAYDVLKDDEKRAAYDRFGHAAFEAGGMGGGGRGGGFGFEQAFGGGFADIFDEMFGDLTGGRRTRETRGRGSDLRYNMEITLEDAFNGTKTQIRVPTMQPCDSCDGTGSEGGSRPVSCSTCGGRGRVRTQQGFFTMERTCPSCGGAGQMIENPCSTCNGAGRMQKERTLSVTIPQGVDDGTRIRLAGEGEAGLRGGPAGDLYIFLRIAAHKMFHRDGADLYCRVPISMTQAALGGTIEVPTVDGTRGRVTIPHGTQSGGRFRLRGKGMTELHGGHRGDMYVEVQVETPVNLSKKQRDLLQEFDDAGKGRSTSPQSEGFFQKVKELWDDLTE